MDARVSLASEDTLASEDKNVLAFTSQGLLAVVALNTGQRCSLLFTAYYRPYR